MDPPYQSGIGHGPQPLRDEGGDVLRTEARQNDGVGDGVTGQLLHGRVGRGGEAGGEVGLTGGTWSAGEAGPVRGDAVVPGFPKAPVVSVDVADAADAAVPVAADVVVAKLGPAGRKPEAPADAPDPVPGYGADPVDV